MATFLVAHEAWSKTIRYAWGGRQQRRHPADPMVPAANYRTDVAIVADAKLALQALLVELNLIKKPFGGNGKETIKAAKDRKFSAFRELAVKNDVPILPERIVATLHEARAPVSEWVA